MASRAVFERVKAATVALAVKPKNPLPPDRMPFLIVGSGFCIEPQGMVVTCEHVISAFTKQNIREVIAATPLEGKANTIVPLEGLEMVEPQVLFFRFDGANDQMVVIPAPFQAAVAKLEYDLGAIRLGPHPAFQKGYPSLAIEAFGNVYEGLEVGTCGFPLGTFLHAQLGTNSSSFTTGIISSIAPAPGAREELVTGYQLDITATNGNSGGPVFNLATGKVLGVLQGGPRRRDKSVLHGLARAESIFRFLRDGTIERARTTKAPF